MRRVKGVKYVETRLWVESTHWDADVIQVVQLKFMMLLTSVAQINLIEQIKNQRNPYTSIKIQRHTE